MKCSVLEELKSMLTGVQACGLPICVFFFNDTATTEIYTLSLHDALPICWRWKLRKT